MRTRLKSRMENGPPAFPLQRGACRVHTELDKSEILRSLYKISIPDKVNQRPQNKSQQDPPKVKAQVKDWSEKEEAAMRGLLKLVQKLFGTLMVSSLVENVEISPAKKKHKDYRIEKPIPLPQESETRAQTPPDYGLPTFPSGCNLPPIYYYMPPTELYQQLPIQMPLYYYQPRRQLMRTLQPPQNSKGFKRGSTHIGIAYYIQNEKRKTLVTRISRNGAVIF